MDAKTVLSRYWDGNLPVNVEQIALLMGINVQLSDDLITASGEIELLDNDSVVCRINQRDGLNRRRFTLAHEIGHFALNHLNRGDKKFRDTSTQFVYGPSDYRETEANRFAAELLMPSTMVDWLIKKHMITNTHQLAEIFQVSNAAMVYRLKNLGWING